MYFSNLLKNPLLTDRYEEDYDGDDYDDDDYDVSPFFNIPKFYAVSEVRL